MGKNNYAAALKNKKDNEKRLLVRSITGFLMDISKSALHETFKFGAERQAKFIEAVSERLMRYNKDAGGDPYFFWFADHKLHEELKAMGSVSEEGEQESHGPCPKCGWMVGRMEVEFRIKCQKCGHATEWHPLPKQAKEEWEG